MFSLLFLSSIAHADTQGNTPNPFEAIDGAMLERLCNSEGGLGGAFGVMEQPDEDQSKDIGGFPRWDLEASIGPFTRYSRWAFAPSYKVHTLRYYGRRSPGAGIIELYKHMAPIVGKAGWVEVEDTGFGAAVSWQKTVMSEEGEILLQLSADGGMLSTSLYCVDRTLYDQAIADVEGESPNTE